MKKSIFILTTTVISLLLVFSVIAAGSSTGARSDTTNTDSDPTTNFETNNGVNAARQLTNSQKKEARETCEDSDSRRERIKCRLDYIKDNKEEFVTSYNKAPEACRKLDDGKKGKCVAFYKKSNACYEKNKLEKNKCFKRLANFAKANLKDETENRDGKARDYVILLLYDIQEKIEHAIENGRVNSGTGADAIDKIVEIKEDILNGKTKREVTPKMLQLRTLLKNIKSTIDQESGGESENE